MRLENSPPLPRNFSNGRYPSGELNAVTCFSLVTGCSVNIHLRFQLVLERWRKAGI